MPAIVSCPNCNRKLRVPDELLGRRIKCPGCASTFAAAGDQSPSRKPPSEEDSLKSASPEPNRRSAAKDDIQEESDYRGTGAPVQRRRRKEEADDDEDDAGDDDRNRRRRRRRAEEVNDDEDAANVDDRRPRRRRPRTNWPRLRQGITLVLASWLVLIGSVIVAIIGGMLIACAGAPALNKALASGGPGNKPGNVGSSGFAALGGLAMLVVVFAIPFLFQTLKVLGYVFCLSAPRKHAARILAIVTLSLGGAALACFLLGTCAGGLGGFSTAGRGLIGNSAGVLSILFGLLRGVLVLAEYIVFLFFLRAVCLAVDDEFQASRVVAFMVGIVAFICVTLVSIFGLPIIMRAMVDISGNAGGQGLTTAGYLALAWFGILGLAFLGMVGWYIVLLFQVRAAIGDRIDS